MAPAEDTDDAELHAVAFAIRELKDRLRDSTVVCDHEPVVTEINEKKEKSGQKRPVLLEILDECAKNSNIKVEHLESNPAHRVLNRYVREHSEIELAI